MKKKQLFLIRQSTMSGYWDRHIAAKNKEQALEIAKKNWRWGSFRVIDELGEVYL